jgi:hypothetical protein
VKADWKTEDHGRCAHEILERADIAGLVDDVWYWERGAEQVQHPACEAIDVFVCHVPEVGHHD